MKLKEYPFWFSRMNLGSGNTLFIVKYIPGIKRGDEVVVVKVVDHDLPETLLKAFGAAVVEEIIDQFLEPKVYLAENPSNDEHMFVLALVTPTKT